MLEAFALKEKSKTEKFLIITPSINSGHEMIIWHPLLEEITVEKNRNTEYSRFDEVEA